MAIKSKTKTFQTIFRGKFAFPDCATLADLAACAEKLATEFRAMEKDGVKIHGGDDYFFLSTKNAKVAKKYDMELADDEDVGH